MAKQIRLLELIEDEEEIKTLHHLGEVKIKNYTKPKKKKRKRIKKSKLFDFE